MQARFLSDPTRLRRWGTISPVRITFCPPEAARVSFHRWGLMIFSSARPSSAPRSAPCGLWRRASLIWRGLKDSTTTRGPWKRDSSEKERAWDAPGKPNVKQRKPTSASLEPRRQRPGGSGHRDALLRSYAGYLHAPRLV